MLNKETFSNIRQRIANGLLEDAFVDLERTLGELPDDFILLKARYERAKRNHQRNLMNDRDFTVEESQCGNNFLELLKPFEHRTDKKSPALKLNPKYQLTCDRSKQYNAFEMLLDDAENARIHYFYLHGCSSHKHESLFKRFVNRAEGEEQPTGYKVVPISIADLNPDADLSRLALEFSKRVLQELGNPDCTWPKIPERSLTWGISNGAQTRHLGKDGKVLIHLSITDAIWSADAVPGQALSFIQNFCKKERLPDDGPEVFFFFSIEYSDDDADLRQAVETAMEQATYLKNMGELQMVSQTDVKNWFSRYRRKWEDNDACEDARTEFFSDEPELMYMKNVERKLGKIINSINNS